jgi:dCTP deaminase
MILSDRDLRAELQAGRLTIEPFDPEAIQPSSIDLRVGDQFRVFANHRYPHIDVRRPMDKLTELVEATEEDPFILHPGEFVLGTTLESVTLPDNLVARLEGKSSLGRLGLLIHSTAGWVDAGFSGQLTLELSNVANLPIAIYPGMPVGQLCLFLMTSPAERPYGSKELRSKYQAQSGPTSSRFHENFREPAVSTGDTPPTPDE